MNVAKMKKMPTKEKQDVTRSVMDNAFNCPVGRFVMVNLIRSKR